ncbi:hypothetical protein PCANC_11197 [Puccinia coronata f. sp. avenae]|uniref:Uncharacterized protein n=1 Tax=Puccinia coronata f. sp. avenae TaxID=200324 RepID=A0A2N5V8J8_9BASI|nr:hypothetical protein PCANC_11197 [Puccinia coronata f. sp. avenae]
MAASELIADTAIQFKLRRRATDLNQMAASNVNSDAAIRASFAGCVSFRNESLQTYSDWTEILFGGQDLATPLISKHLDFYPELTKGGEVYKFSQSQKWLKGLSPATTPRCVK